jgi:hypothetical protein
MRKKFPVNLPEGCVHVGKQLSTTQIPGNLVHLILLGLARVLVTTQQLGQRVVPRLWDFLIHFLVVLASDERRYIFGCNMERKAKLSLKWLVVILLLVLALLHQYYALSYKQQIRATTVRIESAIRFRKLVEFSRPRGRLVAEVLDASECKVVSVHRAFTGYPLIYNLECDGRGYSALVGNKIGIYQNGRSE